MAVKTGQPRESFDVVRAEAPVGIAVRAAPYKVAERLVGMHQRQAETVGQLLLCQQEGHAEASANSLRCGSAFDELHQQGGDVLHGAASANRKQVVVHHQFFERDKPGDVEAHR